VEKRMSETRGSGIRVGFTYDLKDDYRKEGYAPEEIAEFDSETTIAAISAALREMGCEVDRIGNAKALLRRLLAGDRWDLVFNIAEGIRGRNRESQVPVLLEMFGIPHTMSDALTCGMTLDKEVAKKIVRAVGLETPKSVVVRSESDLSSIDLRYPLFAKPLAEGTGKGINHLSRIDGPELLANVCRDLLTRFRQPVLVEEFLSGREFTTSVIGTGDEAHVLGTLELEIRKDAPASDYSYEVKDQYEKYVRYFLPQREPVVDDVEALALAAYRGLECRDAGRIDIRLNAEGRPAFIEANPLPGLHPVDSDLPITVRLLGMEYNTLIQQIVESALKRHERLHSLQ
jgi:D-alanine-D-alanine ligase